VKGLDGLLRKQYNDNIHNEGLVVISASSNEDDPKNVVASGSDSGHDPAARPSLWLCFNVKDTKVKMSSYSIQSPKDGASGLKSC
jgi:hypothetical protein